MRFILIALILVTAAGCGKPVPGAPGSPGLSGRDGAQGNPGVAGQDGHNGEPCTVVAVSPGPVAPNGGALVSCGSSSVVILNGAPGAQGIPGPSSSYAVDSMIDPCGDTPGVYDEVLLRLANGTVLASFSDNINGYNTRLSVIPPGNYQTTDGSNCLFTITQDGNVVWQ